MAKSLTQTFQEKLREDSLRNLGDRESNDQQNRMKLRDFVVQLREAGDSYARAPASTSSPSFKIGDVKNFPGVSERLPETPGAGNLSPAASKDFFESIKDAGMRNDASSRDAATGRAAKTVAQDWAHQHGLGKNDSVKAHVLHEARAQAVFVGREVGAKVGLDPVSSTLVGYSLERALEREGFKVLANHAIDKGADIFKASAAAVTSATGNRHAMESTLTNSMNWMASHGVTKDAFKEVLNKHMGKLTVVATLASNPEVVQRAAQVLSKSDKALDGVMALAKDEDLRKAVGTMTLSAGESLAHLHKGAGSVAILAGSAMRGDSAEETGRHAFRAALSVLGGAAGGVAAGAVSAGFGSVAGAVAGSVAGAALADRVLAVYDDHFNKGVAPSHGPSVAKDELKSSEHLVAERIGNRMKEEIAEHKGAGGAPRMPERVADMQREYSMGKPQGKG